MENHVFVNRTLNVKKMKYLGLDMDHTLVRYNTQKFESLAYQCMLKKLVDVYQYPKEILKLKFDFDKTIRGLVIDKKNGNLLKLNRHSGIRISTHGTQPIDFKKQKWFYKSTYADLGDANYYPIDTTFSISPALLYAQLVDLKEGALQNKLPVFPEIANNVLEALDEAHRDGTIKDEVRKNVETYIIKDAAVVEGLERYKRNGKKIFILTNSYFAYTKLLLDYAINPFLKEHKHWSELFEFVITGAQKPRFFFDKLSFLKIDLESGKMENTGDTLEPGIYQGGCESIFTENLGVDGGEILYLGDHIYGDILRLKKDCNWRTGLVIEELYDEVNQLQKARPVTDRIEELMQRKAPLEKSVLDLQTQIYEHKKDCKEELDKVQSEISIIDKEISDNIKKHHSFFNEYWGEVMRIGGEESYFASQVDRYACVYMPRLSDLLAHSPRTYFRSFRRTMPHEV